MAHIWGAGSRGSAPPRTLLLSGGLRHPDPPKRRSAPLAAMVVRFLATEPLVRGSCAARGRTSTQKYDLFYEEATCPGQLRCLGQNFFQKIVFLLKKPLVPGRFAAWGRTFLKKRTFRNSGTPLRRTRRRKSPNMDFQEFWDSCAQNKASEISKK